MRYKIGIISDTHDILRTEVITDLQGCDYILHAGDIMKADILLSLQNICKVIVVKGNNDYLDFNEEEYFDISGYRFYMTHHLSKHQDVDFYVFGHSHKYAHYQEDSTVYLNPGGCGRRRFSLELTYIILYLDNQSFTVEKRRIRE